MNTLVHLQIKRFRKSFGASFKIARVLLVMGIVLVAADHFTLLGNRTRHFLRSRSPWSSRRVLVGSTRSVKISLHFALLQIIAKRDGLHHWSIITGPQRTLVVRNFLLAKVNNRLDLSLKWFVKLVDGTMHVLFAGLNLEHECFKSFERIGLSHFGEKRVASKCLESTQNREIALQILESKMKSPVSTTKPK